MKQKGKEGASEGKMDIWKRRKERGKNGGKKEVEGGGSKGEKEKLSLAGEINTMIERERERGSSLSSARPFRATRREGKDGNERRKKERKKEILSQGRKVTA